MNQAFPQFTTAIVKAYNLQSLDLTEKELENLNRYSEDSYKFYKIIMQCKSDDLKSNFRCISTSFKDTSCATELSELTKCKSFLEKDLKKNPNPDPKICFKQDRNLSSCIDDLSSSIIFLKSNLPLRISQLS